MGDRLLIMEKPRARRLLRLRWDGAAGLLRCESQETDGDSSAVSFWAAPATTSAESEKVADIEAEVFVRMGEAQGFALVPNEMARP